jgi:repressor LexA
VKYEIGSKIRRLREAKKLSQKEFASLIGVSNSRVSNWEMGINRPDVDILSTICDVLEVSADALLDLHTSEIGEWSAPLVSAYASAIRPTQEAACAVLGIPHVKPDPLYKPEVDTCDMLVYSFPAAAGIPVMAEDDYERIEFPESEVPSGADFGIRIKGDSMQPTIMDESIVFVRKQPELQNGQLGIFMIDDEAACKRFYKKGNTVSLKSDNPAYSDIIIKDHQRFYVVGKVLGYR